MQEFDVIIVGASFSGLSLAHHLPKNLKVLIIDRKTRLDAAIESTGLVTEATKALLAEFCDVDAYIPNKITTIGVVSPDYGKYFFSSTDKPWIYSTDTPMLVKHISEKLSANVELQLGATLLGFTTKNGDAYPVQVSYTQGEKTIKVQTKFFVGADGAHSAVARFHKGLSVNTKFLSGLEKVFFGDITFGEEPDNTIYHFWFGKFSLGYGGWLSPTIIDGKKAFRLGLAKLPKDIKEIMIIEKFIDVLVEKKIIHFANNERKAVVSFGHLIPIGGALKKVYDEHTLLVGDAAGFCGAFAADGIKGSIVSGKVGAKLIAKYLAGDLTALKCYHKEIQSYNRLMHYFKKQQLYRFLWDRMTSDRSFHILYNLIAKQKDRFLYQFCDSKDRHKSLLHVVLRVSNIPALMLYAGSLVLDLFGL